MGVDWFKQNAWALILFTISIGGFVVSLAQLIIGARYLDKCPGNRMLPVFNIISGVFGIVNEAIFFICGCMLIKDKKDKTLFKILMIMGGLLFLAFFPWYIYGYTLFTSVDENSCVAAVRNITALIGIFYWTITGIVIVVIMCVCGLTIIGCCNSS